MHPDGALAAWSSTEGQHELSATLAVLEVPAARPRVVVAQIHQTTSHFVLVYWDGGELRWKLNSQERDSLGSVALGSLFSLRLLVSDGGAAIHVNGAPRARFDVSHSDLYFKTGAYNQTRSGLDYSSVAIHELRVSHR
jgi:hypothetical protein